VKFSRPEAAYLDMQGLAVYTSISVRCWRDYLRRPDAPPVIRLPGKILVARLDVDAWLARFRETPGQDLRGMVDEIAGRFTDTKTVNHTKKGKGNLAAVAPGSQK
jgi:hypothetical protein